MNTKTLKRVVKRYGLPALAVFAILVGGACDPTPDAPPVPATLIPPAQVRAEAQYDVNLAPGLPDGATTSNYASIIRIKGTNWGYGPGTLLRLDQTDRAFVGNHGGYDLIVEHC